MANPGDGADDTADQQVEEESQNPEEIDVDDLSGPRHEEHRNPTESARNRRNAETGATSDEQVASTAEQVHGEFSENLIRQKQREGEFRRLTRQFETEAAGENDDPDSWFNEAIATGQKDVDSFEHGTGTNHYTEDSEFFDEEIGLLNYMQQQADRLEELDNLVSRWVEVHDSLRQEEEKLKGRKGEVEQQVNQMSKEDLEESGYDSIVELLDDEMDNVEEEIEEELPEIKDRKQRARNQKQNFTSERSDRVEEVRRVHDQYEEDVEQYVEARTDQLQNIFRILRTTQNNAGEYEQQAVENNFEGGAELDQAQQELAQNNEMAAVAYANKAKRVIEEIDGVLSDYERVTEAVTDKVEERLEQVESIYEHLTPEDYDGDDDLAAIGSRVTDMLEDVTGKEHSYDDLARLAEGLNRREV